MSNDYRGPKRLPPQAHEEGMHYLQYGELYGVKLADLHPNDVRAALGLYAAKLAEAQRRIDELEHPGLIVMPGR